MNLMKLFNFNYFKENIRKSKAVLAFFLGVIPLLNILLLIIAIINMNNDAVLLDFSALSVITFLGMYVLPLILAYSLFGFIFKRKSVDFVMSKPLSRKTIYFTNILGGLIVLSVFILLNTFIFLLFSIFAPFVIPFSLIIDYMIFWLVSYIFMFSVSVLAMSICGNLISTIVVMFIIVCLVPYLNMVATVFDGLNSSTNYVKISDEDFNGGYYCGTLECTKHLEKNEYSLYYNVLPSKSNFAPLIFLNNKDTLLYSLGSVIKMLILSLLYIFVGFYTFSHRKMENNETSFKSEKMHYIVKIITLLPVSLITYAIIHEAEITGLLISLTIIFIYSIVYDLITRKEIYKFGKSTIISLVFFGIFSGGYGLYHLYRSDKVIELEKFDKITFEYSEYDDTIDIVDKDLINRIIVSALKQDGNLYKNITISTNNKKYNSYVYITEELNQEIKELIENKKESELSKLDSKDIIYTNDIMVDNKLQDLIIDTINKDDFSYTNQNEVVSFYVYDKHNYKEYNIAKGINEKLDNYVLEKLTKKAINIVKKHKDKEQIITFAYAGYNNVLDELQSRLFNYVINHNLDSFLKYLESNNEYTEDTTKVMIYGSTNSIVLPIGDSDSFKEEFLSYQDKLQDDEDYQQLVENYKKEIQDNNEY